MDDDGKNGKHHIRLGMCTWGRIVGCYGRGSDSHLDTRGGCIVTDYGAIIPDYGAFAFIAIVALLLLGVGVWTLRRPNPGATVPIPRFRAAAPLLALGLSVGAFFIHRVANIVMLQRLLVAQAAETPIQGTVIFPFVKLSFAASGILFLAYWGLLAFWVYLDARDRWSERAFAFGLLTLLTNVVGWAVYLVARPLVSVCPGCGAITARGSVFCVRCGHSLRPACPDCRRPVQIEWAYCGGCGANLTE